MASLAGLDEHVAGKSAAELLQGLHGLLIRPEIVFVHEDVCIQQCQQRDVRNVLPSRFMYRGETYTIRLSGENPFNLFLDVI